MNWNYRRRWKYTRFSMSYTLNQPIIIPHLKQIHPELTQMIRKLSMRSKQFWINRKLIVSLCIWSSGEITHIAIIHRSLRTIWTVLQFYQIFANRILGWKIRKTRQSKQVKVGILDGLEKSKQLIRLHWMIWRSRNLVSKDRMVEGKVLGGRLGCFLVVVIYRILDQHHFVFQVFDVCHPIIDCC